MPTKKQALQDLFDKTGATLSRYKARDTMLDELEQFYYLDYSGTDEPAEGVEVVHLPHGTNAVDLVQDLLANAGYTLTVPARSERTTDKKTANEAERFLRAVMQQSERAQRQDLISRAGWIAAMRGAVCGRVQVVDDWIDPDAAKSEDWSGVARVPILIQLRDPRWVYPEFGLDGLRYVVEMQRRTVGDVQRSYGKGVLEGQDPESWVEWREYWDRERYAYWAGGQAVKRGTGRGRMGPWPHRMGGIPYSYEYTRQTGHREPEKRIRPLLEGQRQVIERLDRLESMDHTFLGQYTGTAWLVASEESDFELDLTVGGVNYLRQGETVLPLQAGRRPPEMDGAEARLAGHLERGTFPGTMYGVDPGRVVSGYAVSLLNQGGQLRIRPMVSAVEQLVSSLCESVLMVADNHVRVLLDGPIPYVWIDDKEEEDGSQVREADRRSFDPEKLKGFYRVEASMGELMPQDEAENMALATQARAPNATGAPLLSDETIINKYKLADDPAQEWLRIEREKARASPEIQALLRQVLVAEARQELLDQLAELDVDIDAALAEVKAAAMPQTAPPAQLELPPELPPGAMPGGGPPEMPPEVMPQLPPGPPEGMIPAPAVGGPPPMGPEEAGGLPPELMAQLGLVPPGVM